MKCYAYLDIETTGLSWSRCDLTVVGVATFRGPSTQVRQLVGDDISVEGLFDCLKGADEVYTYNGSRFDLPFIRQKLRLDVRAHFRHTDLMYDCWRQGLKGGLKVVENRLSIPRRLVGMDGFMAVRLWWEYVNGNDTGALQTLLEYNREDVTNLHVLREKLGVA
ncbi:MAG: ribonuclease H-like domain-containing protein [Sedimentisphaerales bacterium]|nr:ribonuclease H-like domain-containing protein [Sedimentisphaerales bacterium]